MGYRTDKLVTDPQTETRTDIGRQQYPKAKTGKNVCTFYE